MVLVCAIGLGLFTGLYGRHPTGNPAGQRNSLDSLCLENRPSSHLSKSGCSLMK
jgi:hypothetical protein